MPVVAVYKNGSLRRAVSLLDHVSISDISYLFDHRFRDINDEL